MPILRLKEDSRITGVAPASRAAGTVNGTVIDQLARTDFRGCLAVLKTGAASGTPTTQSVKLQIHDSANNSDFAAVSGLEVESTEDSQVLQLEFAPGSLRRYWKPVLVTAFSGGSSPEVPSDVSLIEYGAGRGPVA